MKSPSYVIVAFSTLAEVSITFGFTPSRAYNICKDAIYIIYGDGRSLKSLFAIGVVCGPLPPANGYNGGGEGAKLLYRIDYIVPGDRQKCVKVWIISCIS